jgi:hypothetical protein
MARGTPTSLALGPGYLYIGALGRVEPVDLTTPWATVDAGWAGLGYTETGSEFDYQLNTSPVIVAEELDPVSNVPDGRTSAVKFNLSEITATNLKRASNGGTITSGTGVVIFEPPDLGTELRTMIGFESEDHTERWIWRQAIMDGAIALQRQKGAANAKINCEFKLEKPATGLRIYRAIFASPQRQ